ncbi:MAG TPA: sigma-54 dependent transcriptional regulator [Polyangiaceae bacterium]|nr:sigma-54 dependent transcriptional regulator [Polyangiaceae bacterium]
MQEVVTHTLLVADPDSVTAPQLQQLLDPEGIRVAHRRDSQTLLQSLQTEEIDAVFLAHGLAQQDPSLVGILTQRFPNIPLVVMLPATSREEFARWVSAGAADFVRLPLDAEEALFTVKKLHFLSSEAEQEQSSLASGVVAQSKAMRDVFALIARVAPGTSTVMIRGESGTGKEVVARRIHEQSRRKNGPFVKVHCAALPEQILESEVFGYERGAFTGASARKPGRVELAEGGTLFLDEIGDISPAVQVKLLRLLQDREYERLGGTQTLKADVRFLSATHRNLEKMVKTREFREDLYYRLNVVRIVLPPLRDRREDIKPMARHFCAVASAANDKQRSFDDEALAVFESSPWRGNVRQLQNFVERLVVLGEHPRISQSEVASELAREEGSLNDENSNDMSVIELDAAVRAAERRALEKALRKAGGNRVLAAHLLGVSRRTLFYKLRVHGIS